MTAEIINAISEAVSQQWAKDAKAVLMSNVPMLIRDKIDLRGALGGTKLIDLLRSVDAQEKLRLVQSPENRLVWGLVPAHVAIEDESTLFLRNTAPKRTESSDRIPPAVKLAFTKPIPPDKKRYVIRGSRIQFTDVPADNLPPGDAIEIPRSEIHLAQIDDDELRSRVIRWASSNSLEAREFFMPPASVSPSSSRNRPNPLAEFLSLLTAEQRRRIMIPSDIVAKFL